MTTATKAPKKPAARSVPVVTAEPEMLPVSTEVLASVKAKLIHAAQKEGRTFAGHVRFVINTWAESYPAS